MSPVERDMLALPVRFGGLGLTNPVECCEPEYQASKHITQELSSLIFQQNQDLSLFNTDNQISLIKEMKRQKELLLREKSQTIIASINNVDTQRCIKLNQEKGSGSWLTVLPLADCGYTLNKQEFRDALCLRCGWSIANMPHFCGCGQKNSVDHTLICKKGGYVAMRHNDLRDLNISMQKEVCRDVISEPSLLPIQTEEIDGTQADRAAPDVSSRGLWSTFE